MPDQTTSARTSNSRHACCSIVVNGGSNLTSAIEEEARKVVEAKYAKTWNSSGLVKRWTLQRKMNAEIAELAEAMMPSISPETLF